MTDFVVKVGGVIVGTSPKKGITLPVYSAQIQELAGEIEFLNDMYRAGDPQVPDPVYDEMLARLSSLTAGSHPLLKKGVIDKAPITRKRILQTPMMSLDKLKSIAEIKEWLIAVVNNKDELVVILPKYNGISLLADDGKDTASTRGDGYIGQNCDEHFHLMNSRIASQFKGITSGEAIISRANWDAHFKGKLAPSGEPYKLNNATVAGLLNCDNPPKEILYVDFVRYNIHDEGLSKVEMLQDINSMGEIITNYIVCKGSELTEEMLDKFYEDSNKVYPIDGLVIDVNDATLREHLGRESNGNPAYARALKLGKWVEEFDTVITGYKFQISKQGKLKGVVTFEPVIINGTEVKQASFYNAIFLHELNLCKWVRIKVKKSGEIIPMIIEVEGIRIPKLQDYSSQKEFDIDYAVAIDQIDHIIAERYEKDELDFDWAFFNHCPSCGERLHWDENNVELLCKNHDCPEMLISKLEHFFLSIGVEEFGRPSIEAFFREGFKSPHAILNITKKQICAIDGFAESSADIILDQFAKVQSTGVSLARLMYALDLFDGKIGEKTVQLIFDNTTDFTIDELVKIKGVSEITASCFIKGWQEYCSLDRYAHFRNLSLPISYVSTPKQELKGDKYVGYSVCFTNIRDHDLEKVIVEQGGKIAGSVSKTTTHLVADQSKGSNKIIDAKKLGIPILTLEEFKTL